MEAVTRVLLVWRLLLSNSSTLVRISLYVVPVAMLVTIWVSLTLDGLVQLYIKRLELAYAGLQGRLSIEAQPFTIHKFNEELTKRNVKVLLRHDQTHLVQLKLNDGSEINKFISLVVFDDAAYASRFQNIADNTLIMNQVLTEQLGEYSSQIKSLKHYKRKHLIHFNSTLVVDTGFLTNKALLFIPKSKYELFINKKMSGFTKIEIPEVNLLKVDSIKNDIDEIASKLSLGSYKLNDILLDTADARQQFSQLRLAQLGLLVLVLSISALTITYAIKLLLILKVKALSIMNRLGLARFDLSLALISGVSSVFILMVLCGHGLHNITFKYVLVLAKMPQSAEVYTDNAFYVLVLILLCVISLVAEKSSKNAVLSAP